MVNKVKELAIHEKDTGSSEVQVAQLTDKIENFQTYKTVQKRQALICWTFKSS